MARAVLVLARVVLVQHYPENQMVRRCRDVKTQLGTPLCLALVVMRRFYEPESSLGCSGNSSSLSCGGLNKETLLIELKIVLVTGAVAAGAIVVVSSACA